MNIRREQEAPSEATTGADSGFFPTESEAHLRDYWYVILKRRWIIAAVSLAVVSVVVLREVRKPLTYTARAILQIDRGRINLVQEVMVQDYWSGYAEFYPTQQRVLRSRTLAQRVVEQLRLWEHPAFGSSSEAPTEDALIGLATTVQGMLGVAQIRNTQLMEVYFTAGEPQLAADLANAISHQYIAFNSEKETNVAKNAEGFIREQIVKIQAEIRVKEELLQEYSQREDLLIVDDKEAIVAKQLNDMTSELSSARGARAAAEARYRSLAKADHSSMPDVQTAPTVQAVRIDYTRLSSEVAELSSKFKDDWPALQRAKASLDEVSARLEREQFLAAEKIVAKARVDYQEALGRERLLSGETDTQKQAAQALNRATTDYNRIKVELDSQRSMLQQLLRRESETGLSADLGETQPVNVRIVESALVPAGSNGPGLRRTITLGTVLGLGLALGLAFFLDYWETNIYTIEDLRRYVQLPYLGMVPRYEGKTLSLLADGSSLRALSAGSGRTHPQGKNPARTRSALQIAEKPLPNTRANRDKNIIGERFKFLRGSLLLSTAGGPPETILVTGPDKNAGKTFVSCNLARSLAALDKKVLLIDADLRNPQLHKVFHFKNNIGLSNVLSGQISIEDDCIFRTPVPNVYLMMAGPLSPNPSELLASSKLMEIVEQCKEHFDFVLLDSAPLLPVFDSHILTARCDATVLVVRSGHTSRNAVKASVESVDRVGGKITGVVLNDVNLNDFAQNYYYSYYSYEYGTYEAVERQSA